MALRRLGALEGGRLPLPPSNASLQPGMGLLRPGYPWVSHGVGHPRSILRGTSTALTPPDPVCGAFG